MKTHRIHEGERQGPHGGNGHRPHGGGRAGTTWWGGAESTWREGDNTDTPCEGHVRKHNKKKQTRVGDKQCPGASAQHVIDTQGEGGKMQG